MNKKTVQRVLEKIRPQIQRDGGDLELVSVDTGAGLVTIRLTGACVGCVLSSITLEAGIAQTLRRQVKGFKSVALVEDYGGV